VAIHELFSGVVLENYCPFDAILEEFARSADTICPTIVVELMYLTSTPKRNFTMKRFTKITGMITGSMLLLAVAACANTETTTAPGAVSGKACCADKSAASCKENKGATCDKTAATPTTPAAASPGAVSGEKKAGCGGGCPMSGGASGCPMMAKPGC